MQKFQYGLEFGSRRVMFRNGKCNGKDYKWVRLWRTSHVVLSHIKLIS